MVVPIRLLKRLARQTRRRDWRWVLAYSALILFSASLFLYLLLAYYLANDPRLVPATIQRARNILLVTAHPDDETLFFSPTILYGRDNPDVTRALLVLSTGDYHGQGDIRRGEIEHSCEKLGIPAARCVVLEHGALQDNPKKWWRDDVIQDIVAHYVEMWKVDLIFTFDNGGVSGHINHRAVSAGVLRYTETYANPPPVYALMSTFLLRKYSSLVDLILTSIPFSWRILKALFTSPPEHVATGPDFYGDKALLVSSWETYWVARGAFGQHVTQFSWDRVLYLVVSRYMWFNDLYRLA
ncbi:glycan biosynthesis protein [Aspergillus heteromorphus CBS 117.55]|uniref:N-acetylglucosaminylphosphatidylinositol deacetylase n=1 Tax=Aspergillus heteromorphus CBS 117.55 TaxID=1448321 RepID=A0A317VF99_9EURO|nr:glycan biosynthesis protein [Aspergillus heteromorphus CBS 117.55]PWY73056.1 glycan biosynthesis protein [Aspergillus heteromorphus CBS 117.55]